MTEHDVGAAFVGSMRRLAGGVGLLTTAEHGRPYGMAVTAIMSVTMDPPALVVGVNRSASIAEPLLRTGRFCISLLGAGQDGLCRGFSTLPSAERFSVGDWQERNGMPYLAEAQAAIFCAVGPVHGFGTHELVVGIVEGVILGDLIAPLIYVDGRYGAVAA